MGYSSFAYHAHRYIDFILSCSQIFAPPQSLHSDLLHSDLLMSGLQILAPTHSLHWDICLSFSLIHAPPHSLHFDRSF